MVEETTAGLAAAGTTNGAETLVETVAPPLTVTRTVALGAGPVLTAVPPTDSEGRCFLVVTAAVERAAPRKAAPIMDRNNIWAALLLRIKLAQVFCC